MNRLTTLDSIATGDGEPLKRTISMSKDNHAQLKKKLPPFLREFKIRGRSIHSALMIHWEENVGSLPYNRYCSVQN